MLTNFLMQYRTSHCGHSKYHFQAEHFHKIQCDQNHFLLKCFLNLHEKKNDSKIDTFHIDPHQ